VVTSFFAAIDLADEFALQNLEQDAKLDAYILLLATEDELIDAYKQAVPRYAHKIEKRREDPEERGILLDMAKSKLDCKTFKEVVPHFALDS